MKLHHLMPVVLLAACSTDPLAPDESNLSASVLSPSEWCYEFHFSGDTLTARLDSVTVIPGPCPAAPVVLTDSIE